VTPRAAMVAKPVQKTQSPKDIIFVSTECAPFSKTGGLGDVVGALPIELAKRGHRVMSIQPRYDQYAQAWDTSVTINIMGEEVRFFHAKIKGVDRVFIDHPSFLEKVWGKTGSKLYGQKSGADYADNPKRFALFCQAAIEAARCLPFSYGEHATFIANDWHSGLVPVYLKEVYKPRGEFKDSKCIFCVHNIAFQGRYTPDTFDQLNLPASSMAKFDFTDGNSKIYDETSPADEDEVIKPTGGKFKKVNWMKAAFLSADRCVTVSPNYAKEVATDDERGVELSSVINQVGIEGIVNGMDVIEWNPMTDKYLSLPYDEDTVAQGKAVAKAELQSEVGLPVSPTAPVFGFIGRLEEQKGVDILLKAVPGIVAAGGQVVILGTGKKKLEKAVEQLEKSVPGAAGVVKFSQPVAHLITAGADYMMVPSRFEPCGLVQLHAMRYGTVPVVASVGGLVDTVKEGKTGFHMGRLDPDTITSEDVQAVVSASKAAIDAYPSTFPRMSKACIAQDLSWAEPARKWEGLIEEVVMGTGTAKKHSVATPVQKVA